MSPTDDAPAPGPKELLTLFAVLLTLVFAGLVGADHAGFISVLDAEYRRNGFCVAEHSSYGFNSYQMSFIVDTTVCAILLPMKRARPYVLNVASLFFHGLFHLLQYLYGWPQLPVVLHIPAYTLFTLGFMSAAGVGFRVGSKSSLALGSLALVATEYFLVPNVMKFAFANVWISLVGMGGAMATPPDKQLKFGTSWAATLLLLFGVGMFPFCEALFCNRGVKPLGGHAIFDATLAIHVLVSVVSAGGFKGKSS